jgi:ADP-ribosylglycohydrolase
MSDGAAMRIAPIGIISAGDPEKAAKLAKIDASVSHWRDGIWGAQAVAAAISMAMVEAPIDEIIGAAAEVIPEDSWFSYTFNKGQEIVENADSLEEAWTPLHTEFRTTYKASVPEAISQAFALYKLLAGDFRNCVIYSGNFGRDADTIGAVVGALSGARNGVEKISDRWLEKVRYPTGTCLDFTEGQDLKQIAKDLAALIK